MNLKASYCKFNKSIVKADIKRFWWVSVLYALGIFLFYTFNYIQSFYANSHGMYATAQYTYTRIFSYGWGLWFFSLTVPVALGSLLFSYMQSGAPSTFAHSIPVTRGQNFVSHLVSGFIMILFPHIVNTAIFLLYRFDASFAESYRISHLLIAMYTSVIYALVAFSIASFMSFVAGNTIASIVFSYVLGFLPVAVEAFIKEFLYIQLFGYIRNWDNSISEQIYIVPRYFTNIKYIIYYLILACVFFALAFLVYRLRNLENHSEVVAFPKIKPIFIYGVAIGFGCVGYLYFNALFDFVSALFLIPFGVIGIVVAQMISQKTFRVRGVFKTIAIYSLCIVALFAVFHFDLTGYEARVPSLDKVTAIDYELNINYEEEIGYDKTGLKYYYDDVYEPIIEDTDTIADVIKLHRVITENKDSIAKNTKSNYAYSNMPLKLTYHLKGGKLLERRYEINYNDFKNYLNPVAESDTIRKAYFPILRERDIEIESISLGDERLGSNEIFAVFYNDDREFQLKILDALKTDLLNAKADEYADRRETFTKVVINYKRNAHYQDGKPVELQNVANIIETYYIRPSYVNTRLIIEGFGEYGGIYKPEDIEKIGVVNYNRYNGDREIEVTTGDIVHHFNKIIDNEDKIKQVYEYFESKGFSRDYSDGYVTVLLKNGAWHNYDFSSADTEFIKILGLEY